MRRNKSVKRLKEDAHRPGTASLARRPSLAATVLGLCELASTEIRLSPQMHQGDLQQLYTLCHEGRHRELFLTTTFGYTQFLLARIDVAGRSNTLPSHLRGAHEALCDAVAKSFDAHEGYATISEYIARDSLVALGSNAPDVPHPTPRYQRAMTPYRAVLEALPAVLRPFSHFLLRAFAEIVFDTGILQIARATNINVGNIRASLLEQRAQPDYRLTLLSKLLVERFENEPLGIEWAYFTRMSESAPGIDISRMISELRFKTVGLDGVRLRRIILTHARRTVRAAIGFSPNGLLVDNGLQTIHTFHNWCFNEFAQLRLLNGPMLSFDDDPEESAKHTVKNQHVSGLPAEILPIVAITGDTSRFVEQTLSDATKRVAIALRIRGDGTEEEATVCQVRLVLFVPRTEAWNGPGTEPYQRIFVDCPCFDKVMPIAEAGDLLEKLSDCTDIIYFNTVQMNQAQAALSDRVVGATKATMIHLIDEFFGMKTDKERVDALRKLHSLGRRGFCPFDDENWLAIFFELSPHTFLGAVVLRKPTYFTFDGDLDRWIEQCTKEQPSLLNNEDYKSSLGSLSTFVKIFINGGFRDAAGG